MAGQITQLQQVGGLIDFGIGQPDFSLLPHELVKESAAQFPLWIQRDHLQYGAEAGDPQFLAALSTFLTKQYQEAVSPEELFVTNGVSQGLDLVCTLFTRPGDVIFVEEPTYFLALQLFADHGLHVVGIPMDGEGVDLSVFNAALAKYTPVFFYTIAAFHNPTGRTLTAARREALVALSERHQFLIVADEVYHPLAYTIVPPPPFAAYIDSGWVISLGSFSKILAPGLRLGWIQTQSEHRVRLLKAGLLQSGGGLNPITAAIVCGWLQDGRLSAHLQHLRQVYTARAVFLASECRRHLPDYVTFEEPEGGFFIWLNPRSGTDIYRLQQVAREMEVDFQPGHLFSTNDSAPPGMRLCFAYYDERKLGAGVLRLAAAFAAL